MLYGTDYQSGAARDDRRLQKRFRRDVMFLFARPQEVTAAGFIAGVAVAPIVVSAAIIVTFLFSIVFGSTGGALPAGLGLNDQSGAATSPHDVLLALVGAVLLLAAAGAASAYARQRDYQRQGGLRYYLHQPRSALALASFFAPVTAAVIATLLHLAVATPRANRPDLDVAAPSLLDRGVLYFFLGVTLSMLLYLVWEACFPLILPTLSRLDADAEVARLQREDVARVQAEEERLRGTRRGHNLSA